MDERLESTLAIVPDDDAALIQEFQESLLKQGWKGMRFPGADLKAL